MNHFNCKNRVFEHYRSFQYQNGWQNKLSLASFDFKTHFNQFKWMSCLKPLDCLNTAGQKKVSNSPLKLYLHKIILRFQIQDNFNSLHEFVRKISKGSDFKIFPHWNSWFLKTHGTHLNQTLKSFQNFGLQTTRLDNERRQQDHLLGLSLRALQTLAFLGFDQSKSDRQQLDWSWFQLFKQLEDL